MKLADTDVETAIINIINRPHYLNEIMNIMSRKYKPLK